MNRMKIEIEIEDALSHFRVGFVEKNSRYVFCDRLHIHN